MRCCAQNVPQDDSFHVPKDGVCGSPSETLIRTYSRGVELLLNDFNEDLLRAVELLLKDRSNAF